MSIVDWAHVVLPVSALGFGVYLVIRHRTEFDRWLRKIIGD